MIIIPKLFTSSPASSVIIAFMNSGSPIFTGLLQQCKISFSLKPNSNVQIVTTDGWSLCHSVDVTYS